MRKIKLDLGPLEVESFETTDLPFGTNGMLYGQTPYPSQTGQGCTCLRTNCTSCAANPNSWVPDITLGCAGPCEE